MRAFTSTKAPDQAVPPRPPSRTTETLYFAYGSNLHIAQMAQRCPGSFFKGKATLEGWRWQINERGVANVVRVRSKDSLSRAVDGLVFSITPKDQRALDRSEGVSRGFYEKYILMVGLEPHAHFCNIKTLSLAELPFSRTDPDGPTSALAAAAVESPGDDEPRLDAQRQERQPPAVQYVKVLVYVSEEYTTDGVIRKEYIARMRKAVFDATALGVSRAFLDNYIAPHLVDPDATTSAACQETTGITKKDASINDSEASEILEGDDRRGGPKSQAPGDNDQLNSANMTILGPSHQVALRALALENREPSEDLRFPRFAANMLEALSKNSSGAGDTRKSGTVYVVVMNSTHKTSGVACFNIKAMTHDPELANELAMKALHETFMDGTQGEQVRRELAASLFGLGDEEDRPSVVEWNLDGEGCLHLKVDNAAIGSYISVWVEKQKVLVAV